MIVATCEVLLLGLLICGAIWDIAAFRLPNWLTLGTAVVALPWLLLTSLSLPPIFLHLLAGLIMLGGGMLAFRFNILGGGDVKWLAGLALWTGFNLDLLRLLMLTAFFGGALAIIVLLLSRFRRDYGLQEGKRHLPYGVAIAGGGVDFWVHHSRLGHDLIAAILL